MEEVVADPISEVEPSEKLPLGEFMTTAYRCRCGHEWAPRPLGNPRRPTACPKCKTPNWDRPKKFERKAQD